MTMRPISGDPGTVASSAVDMRNAAEQMRAAAAALRDLQDRGGFQSEAIGAVRKNASGLAGTMQSAYVRYDGASDALREYAPELARAQDLANQAIHAAGQTDVSSAQHTVDTLEFELLNPLLTPQDRQDLHHRLAHAQSTLHEQQAALGTAQGKYADAMEILNAAATKAVGRIQDAIEASHLNDTAGDKFRHTVDQVDQFLSDLMDALIEVLDTMGTVCAIAALVLCWIPGVAEVLGGLAIVFSLASVAGQLVRTMEGRESWAAFAGAAIGAAVGIVLGKLGGRLIEGAFIKLAPEVLTAEKVTDEALSHYAEVESVTEESVKFLFTEGGKKWYEGETANEHGWQDVILDPEHWTEDHVRQLVEPVALPGVRSVKLVTRAVVTPQARALQQLQERPLACTYSATASGGGGW